MKSAIKFILIILASLTILVHSVYSEKTKAMTYKERETEKQIDAQRKSGFSDVEIDTLHESISTNLQEIKKLRDMGVEKQSAIYLTDIPATDTDIFKTDKDGKTYIQFALPQGQSYVDWPKIYLYDGVGFIYPSEDYSQLDKIVLMFRRVNAEGQQYTKEMRRLINPTPKNSVTNEDGTVSTDSNSDIQLEYYQSMTSNTVWPDKPILDNEPDVKMELNNADNLLPYEKQKLIMHQYKKILRKVDKIVALRLRGLQLDQRRMVTKMLEYK
ncbi:LIC13212 family protein [Leptospira sp. GIMC2001]|uniref:LIC13212 family protein n=1 Tax=Leptospira sp. GIMC2001 TaxID=1513297 RepID=UPI00234A6C4B|nr:hypothetical protein [Leptospira sp. GIMC2001]WCL49287.1 hypothetical protein O4O04_18645 [Leptospira sp. GIMC2001]